MTRGSRPLYEERTPWAPWMSVVFWGAVLGSTFLVLATEDIQPASARGAVAAAILSGGFLLHWLLAGLRVAVHRDHLEASLGRAGLIRSRIPWGEVRRVEAVTYAPLRDFGGWGFRVRRGSRAWTARGDQAVVLHLEDGTKVFVGSGRPERLRGRIRSAAGAEGERPPS